MFFFCLQIYTPKVSKKVLDEVVANDDNVQSNDNYVKLTKCNLAKPSGNKIWTFVSSILQFASLSTNESSSVEETASTETNSISVIKRCASFAGNKSIVFINNDD